MVTAREIQLGMGREALKGNNEGNKKQGSTEGDQGQKDLDEGWTRVTKKRGTGRRRVERMDIAFRKGISKDVATVSYFFTHFPDTHGAKEMLGIFKLYGNVVEVVIPAKKDKRGKRFGFARFTNVEDPRLFATKLDNIIIGATKIYVNPPRFQRQVVQGKHSTRPQNGRTGEELRGAGRQPRGIQLPTQKTERYTGEYGRHTVVVRTTK